MARIVRSSRTSKGRVGQPAFPIALTQRERPFDLGGREKKTEFDLHHPSDSGRMATERYAPDAMTIAQLPAGWTRSLRHMDARNMVQVH